MENEPGDREGATLPDRPAIELWIEQARQGSTEALGLIVENCRGYLLNIANRELPRHLRGKVAPSDLVQDTFVEVQNGFARFQGQRREELLGWLRRILLNNLANAHRRYCDTDMRDVSREVSLDGEDSDGHAPRYLLSATTPPPAAAEAAENAQRVAAAIERLPADFQQVILLRHREDLSFAEIGTHMSRSADAARKLWGRAVERLQKDLVTDDDFRT